MSRRSVRGVTSSRAARSAPDQSGLTSSKESSRSSLADVSTMNSNYSSNRGPILTAIHSSVADMNINWNEELLSQLTWHWDNQLRPRLTDLTDDEYFWAPAQDCWTLSRRGASKAPISVGAGEYTMDYG